MQIQRKGEHRAQALLSNQVSLLAKGQTSPLISPALQFLRSDGQRNLVTMYANAAGGDLWTGGKG